MTKEERLLRKILGIGMGKEIELKLPEGLTAKDMLKRILKRDPGKQVEITG